MYNSSTEKAQVVDFISNNHYIKENMCIVDPDYGARFIVRTVSSIMGKIFIKVYHILMQTIFHATKSRIKILKCDSDSLIKFFYNILQHPLH